MKRKSIGKGPRYYGWTIAYTLAITETISYGVMYYAFSVFLTPMEAELGWTRGQLTGGFSLMLLVSALMAYPVGAWVDRHGSRVLMTVGSAGASVLMIAWSQVTGLTAYYLIWMGMGVCAAAVFYEPAFAVIAAWFDERRSAALAIITLVAGLASTIFLPLSDALLNLFGWRDAVFLLGVLLAVTTVPLHGLLLRRHPADLGLRPDGGKRALDEPQPARTGATLSDALHSRFFWVMTLAFTVSGLSAAAIRVHFVPLLIDAGINASTAAWASGSIGILQVTGRIIFAPLDMRFSGRTMVTGLFALQAAAISFLMLGSSMVFISIFIVMFGASYGARTLARPSILAELFGSRHYGRISSINAIFITLAATLAPVGAGLLYDGYGSYGPVLWVLLILALVSIGMMLFSRPDVVRRPEREPAIVR